MALPIEDLREGSVVRLVSGSPKMVVTHARPDAGVVDVVWWSDRLGMQEDTFSPAILVYPRAPDAAEGADA